MDVNQLLIAQHREVKGLLAQLAEAEADERTSLVTTLASKLRLHMELEEQIVYPAMVRVLDDGDEAVEEATAEHGLAREGLDKLEAAAPDFAGFDGLVEMVKAGIEHHVEEEEGDVFPDFAKAASSEEREELGRRCEAHMAAAGVE